jgi:hypothetical protein
VSTVVDAAGVCVHGITIVLDVATREEALLAIFCLHQWAFHEIVHVSSCHLKPMSIQAENAEKYSERERERDRETERERERDRDRETERERERERESSG